MNCPHCKNEMPPNYHASKCPFCSGNIQSRTPVARTNWWIFVGELIAPAILTSLVVLTGAKTDQTAGTVAFVASVIGGILCGTTLGRRGGNSLSTRIVLSVIFSGLMFLVSIGMSCVGCLTSGYQMNLR